MSEQLMKMATSIAKDSLIQCVSSGFSLNRSIGVCIGKFTKSGKFKLQITSLDILARYAKNKIWLKPHGEQAFIYGNHVIKAHIGRMSENIVQYSGVVVFSMNDTPLGFGVTSRSTLQSKDLDPTGIVCFNYADIGEYLRLEEQK